MKMHVLAVYDSKGCNYGKPFYMRTLPEAVRGFAEVANDEQTQICKYPEDYALFDLGSFDDETCKFSLHSSPISLGLAIEFKRPSDIRQVS